MSEQETVSVPRWALEMVLVPERLDKMCGVCRGRSPAWDGHDRNPPCVGHAKEVLRESLTGG